MASPNWTASCTKARADPRCALQRVNQHNKKAGQKTDRLFVFYKTAISKQRSFLQSARQ